MGNKIIYIIIFRMERETIRESSRIIVTQRRETRRYGKEVG